ncbi:hypothetical protein ACOQFL_02650 [Actinopolyspora sp. H202]
MSLVLGAVIIHLRRGEWTAAVANPLYPAMVAFVARSRFVPESSGC